MFIFTNTYELLILFDILCTFHSTEDSRLEFLKHFVSNGTVFCNRQKTGRKHLVPVIMLHVLSMINEPSYPFAFDATMIVL